MKQASNAQILSFPCLLDLLRTNHFDLALGQDLLPHMKQSDVQQWILQSQRNIPYELDFYTPFKEMATGEAKQKSKEAMFSHEKSISSSISPETPKSSALRRETTVDVPRSSSARYHRRKRQKTKEDRYEYKRTTGLHKRGATSRKRRDTKTRAIRGRRDVANEYHAPNVDTKCLTIQTKGGLFLQGRSSAPARHRALPDLAFPERAFLNLQHRRDIDDGSRDSEEEEQEEGIHDKRARRDRRFLAEDAEMSRFFGNPTAGNRHKTRIHPRANSFVYETPCRQPARGEASPIDIGIDIPGKPYLGFGRPGPLKELSKDPRAQFSPLSNMRYAREQATIQGRDYGRDFAVQGASHLDNSQAEIMRLLKQIHEKQLSKADAEGGGAHTDAILAPKDLPEQGQSVLDDITHDIAHDDKQVVRGAESAGNDDEHTNLNNDAAPLHKENEAVPADKVQQTRQTPTCATIPARPPVTSPPPGINNHETQINSRGHPPAPSVETLPSFGHIRRVSGDRVRSSNSREWQLPRGAALYPDQIRKDSATHEGEPRSHQPGLAYTRPFSHYNNPLQPAWTPSLTFPSHAKRVFIPSHVRRVPDPESLPHKGYSHPQDYRPFFRPASPVNLQHSTRGWPINFSDFHGATKLSTEHAPSRDGYYYYNEAEETTSVTNLSNHQSSLATEPSMIWKVPPEAQNIASVTVTDEWGSFWQPNPLY